ncbi:MAG: heavy-metal-associated protein [Flavipsychrobacter sp.]|jgi:copper chaperone CopZ|nr:heavy-metal-associated protein [Flavipsychrobacter sp.]
MAEVLLEGFSNLQSLASGLGRWHIFAGMKSLYLFVILFATTVSLSFAQTKATTIAIKASIYCDHCRKCESCGERLEKAVFCEKGIKRVDIDEQQKTVNVIFNPKKTSPERIRQAIAKVGFDADDVQADPQAYLKLDDCCKKQ